MTADEFIRVYGDDDGDLHELIEGEVYERTVNGYSHYMVKNNLKELFDQAGVARHGFRCFIEPSFKMADSSVVTPDAALIRMGRLTNQNGTQAVCCAYPNLRNIVVYTAHEWRELSGEEKLEFPALLPDVSILVSEIFMGV